MSGVPARTSRLIADLARERRTLPALVEELAQVAPRLAAEDAVIDRRDLVLVAVDLHHYFTAVETAFERVARDIDDELPAGPDSHRLLVDQMAVEVPALRPALIGEDERLWLQGLRGFRHFFRNAYSAELAPAELHRHALAVIAHHPALARGLDDFVSFLDGLRR